MTETKKGRGRPKNKSAEEIVTEIDEALDTPEEVIEVEPEVEPRKKKSSPLAIVLRASFEKFNDEQIGILEQRLLEGGFEHPKQIIENARYAYRATKIVQRAIGELSVDIHQDLRRNWLEPKTALQIELKKRFSPNYTDDTISQKVIRDYLFATRRQSIELSCALFIKNNKRG